MNKDFQEISIVFFEAFQNGVKKSSGQGDQPCDEVIFRVMLPFILMLYVKLITSNISSMRP